MGWFRPSPEFPLGIRSQNKGCCAYSRQERMWTVPQCGGYRLGGARHAHLLVPMLKENELVGAIAIYRQEVRPFTDRQIELVEEFRSSGRHRHREHAPAQRAARIAATADRHRRRAQGHQPLDLRSAGRAADAGQIRGPPLRCRPGNDHPAERRRVLSRRNLRLSPEFIALVKDLPVRLERGTINGRALLEGKIVHIPDVLADVEYTWAKRKEWAVIVLCSEFQCCARGCRSASWH